MARLITKNVVACCLSFLSLVRATTVKRFPTTPTRPKRMADDAAKTVNDCENSKAGGETVKGTGVAELAALVRRIVSTSIVFLGPTVHSHLISSEMASIIHLHIPR